MALTIEMVIALHTKSKDKVNLSYKRPGGSMGYCYIDPTKPLCAGKSQHSGGTLVQYLKADTFKPTDKVFMTFFKQQTHAQLMLDVTNVEFQNKNKEELLRLIYGSE